MGAWLAERSGFSGLGKGAFRDQRPPDRNLKMAVEGEDRSRRSPDRREPDNCRALPSEMISPRIGPRMKNAR